MRQPAPSGTTDTVGCWVEIDQVGGETMRSCTTKPNGHAVGCSTSCVAHAVRNSSTRCCTMSTNSGVANACSSTGTSASGLSESTATPRVAEIGVSTETE